MKLKNISYYKIAKLFDDEYDIGYLNNDDLRKNLNIPIKIPRDSLEYFQKIYDQNCPNALIFIKHTLDYDYSLRKEVKNILNSISDLKYEIYNGNYKYAAVQAGLGQYGKNQLVYNYKFGFDNHIVIFLIWNKIIDLPERKTPNYDYLSICKDCNDCFNACPVKAIYNKDKNNHWIDQYLCDNFCHFGDDPIIPSIKKSWNKYINPQPLSDNILKKIKNPEDCFKYLGCFPFIFENEKNIFIQYPICRECTSQKKCSKYNGKYPYQNKIKIL